jgi:HEAT repeat protein
LRPSCLLGGTPVAALTEALSDKNKWLRRTSATVLGKIGPKAKSAVPELLSTLDASTDNEQKIQIAAALGKIGDHSQEVLSALEQTAKDKNKTVAREARKSIKILEDAAKKKEKRKNIKPRPERKESARPSRSVSMTKENVDHTSKQ